MQMEHNRSSGFKTPTKTAITNAYITKIPTVLLGAAFFNIFFFSNKSSILFTPGFNKYTITNAIRSGFTIPIIVTTILDNKENILTILLKIVMPM